MNPPDSQLAPPAQPSFSYRVVLHVFRLLFRLLAHLDVKGVENTPPSGPLLIAVNHTTIIEAPLVISLLPRHPVSALAKQEYQGTLIGKVIDVVKPVYVHRGEVDRTALREMLKRLKAGWAFGIAPEGTRSPTGTLQEGKEGTAYLALQTDAWIMPAAVWGHEHALADLKRFRRPLIHVRFGEPYKLLNDPERSRAEKVQAGTERVMHDIARLLPPDRRGVYAAPVARRLDHLGPAGDVRQRPLFVIQQRLERTRAAVGGGRGLLHRRSARRDVLADGRE